MPVSKLESKLSLDNSDKWFILYVPISSFCSMIFLLRQNLRLFNRNHCFGGKSVFCRKDRGFNVHEPFHHIVLIISNNLKCLYPHLLWPLLTTFTMTTTNRLLLPSYNNQVSYDHRSCKRNLSNCTYRASRIEAWKSQDFNGVEEKSGLQPRWSLDVLRLLYAIA